MIPTPLTPSDSSQPLPQEDTPALVSVSADTVQPEPTVQVSSDVPTTTLTEKPAKSLADRYSIAFPNSKIDNQSAFDMIKNNREADLRKQAASQLDFDRTLQQQKIISDYVAQNGPQNLPQTMLLQSIIKQKQANPNTVIEANYAEEFMKTLLQQASANPNSDLAAALAQVPGHVEKEVEKATDLVTRKQRMQTWAEKLQSSYDQQSWVGFGADQAKNFSVIYNEAKLRNLVGGQTGYLDGMLGTNMKKQWSDLMFMPMDQFEAKGEAIVNMFIKDNPSLGLTWLAAGQGMSSSDEALQNLFPVLGVAGGGTGLKVAYGLARRGVLEVAASRAIATAIKQGGEATTTAAVKESVGDIKGAAVDQFTKETTQIGQRTPVLKDMSSLLEARTTPLEDLGFPVANGGFRQEVVNRLRESMNTTFGSFMEAVQKTMKVEQLPAVLAIPRVAQRLAASMENEYRGLVNSIVDTRLVRDQTTGQWFADHYITRNNGTLFASEQEATRYASKLRLGEIKAVGTEGAPQEIRMKVAGASKTMSEAEAVDLIKQQELTRLGEKSTGSNLYKGLTEDQVRNTIELNKNYLPSMRKTVEDPAEAIREPAKVAHLKEQIASAEKDIADKEAWLARRKPGIEFQEGFVPSTESPPVTSVRQQGAGYFLVKSQPVPINADFTRDLMIQTAEQRTPNKVLNAFGGWLGSARTPEETLALENIINRKIATYGSSTFYEAFKESAKEISQLKGWPVYGTARREKWNQWKDFISYLDNVPNPSTGKKGVTEAFQTPGELRDLYIQRLGRPPDEQELKASFAYQTQELLKEQLLKLTKYKNQIRSGATRWTLGGLQDAAETDTISGTLKYQDFTGRRLTEVPSSGTILVMNKGALGYSSVNASILRDASRLKPSAGLGETIAEGIASGKGRLVELTEPDTYPLEGMFSRNTAVGRVGNRQAAGDLRITHVYSEQLQDKALSLDHVQVNKPSNTDYDHYIVQPNIKYNPVTATHEYTGDKTIAGFNVRAMGAEVAEHLDSIRQLFKNGQDQQAQEFYKNSGLPMPYQQIRDWFHSTISPEGVITAPRFSLDDRIHLVPNGKLSIETDKGLVRSYEDRGVNFADRTRESYGQLNVPDPYDIFSLANSGTKANPAWAVAPTKFIDPVTQINRSLVRVINDVNLNDYKVMSIEHWIQEAKDLLKVNDNSLAAAPAYFFHNAENYWLPGLTGEKAMLQQNLMTAQMQIRQFLGVRDANTTFLHNSAQILSDSIYTKFGEKPWMLTMADKLPLLRDPFQFMRSITFNAKLGLFAIPQLLVQLQTFASIYGIAGPGAATAGTHATLLHTWSRINRNPEMIAAFDVKASAFGFRPGEFSEAHALLDSTGFERVAGEHGYRDSTTYHDIVGGPSGTFLNAGQWFFREGERASRTGAFYTAYKEFRDLNPTKKLSEVDSRSILQRADLLSGNMSRASSSTLQAGWASLITQFTSYTIRQAELMIGNRLTNLEKARLFGTYSALYGIPAAAGSFTLGIGNEWIMQKSIESGYVSGAKDNNPANTIMTEGLPAFLGQAMTGNLYNIGQRFAGGSGPVTDLLYSDKHFWEIMGGASGSTIAKSIAGMNGMYTAVTSAIKGTGEFKPKPEDFVAPFEQISSVATFKRWYMALQTGKWLSANEMELGDASPINATFMSVTGLSPQSSPEIGWISHNRQAEKEIQQEGLKDFIKEWRRGLREFDGGNPQQGNDYWQRAFTQLRIKGYPTEDWPKAIGIANEGQEAVASRIRLDYYLKNVPEQRKTIANEAVQRYMQGNK